MTPPLSLEDAITEVHQLADAEALARRLGVGAADLLAESRRVLLGRILCDHPHRARLERGAVVVDGMGEIGRLTLES